MSQAVRLDHYTHFQNTFVSHDITILLSVLAFWFLLLLLDFPFLWSGRSNDFPFSSWIFIIPSQLDVDFAGFCKICDTLFLHSLLMRRFLYRLALALGNNTVSIEHKIGYSFGFPLVLGEVILHLLLIDRIHHANFSP